MGLLTAVVALATGLLALEKERRAALDENAILQANQQRLEQERLASEARIKAELEAERIRREEERHAELCSGHEQTLRTADRQFADLMARHGTLITMLKQCGQSKSDDGRLGCVLIVCAGAGQFYGVDCTAVAQDAIALRDNVERIRSTAASDSCTLGASAVERFYN